VRGVDQGDGEAGDAPRSVHRPGHTHVRDQHVPVGAGWCERAPDQGFGGTSFETSRGGAGGHAAGRRAGRHRENLEVDRSAGAGAVGQKARVGNRQGLTRGIRHHGESVGDLA